MAATTRPYSSDSAERMAAGRPKGVYIVGIGGTTRAGSSTEKALRFALQVAEDRGARTRGFYGPELATLPMYAPELPDRTDVAGTFVEELRVADGIIIASPGYHGSVSGLVKNALDYVEDLRDDPRCYFDGLAVGCIATGAGWQAIVATILQLRTVAHALRGWPTPLGAAINSTQKVFDDDGDVIDERSRFQLETVAREVLQFAELKQARLSQV
jgi:FMN reductase